MSRKVLIVTGDGGDSYEALYGNMPVFGLAAATKHVPAVGRRETARRRLGGESEPAVASPPQPIPVAE